MKLLGRGVVLVLTVVLAFASPALVVSVTMDDGTPSGIALLVAVAVFGAVLFGGIRVAGRIRDQG